MSDEAAAASFPARATWGLSGAVYAQRDGKILILKRAMGEATGGWYLPGGAVEAGEDVEDAARREMFEECGLTAAGPLTLISVHHMHVYGADSLQIAYACDCPDGEVVLSAEHSGARWIDPQEYRERYFRDDVIAQVEQHDAHVASLMRGVRSSLDRYIAWRDAQAHDSSSSSTVSKA